MKILAIETSGKVASTALLEDYKVISEIVLNTKLVHSVMLIDLIDQVLRNASSKIEDVDLFAASIGPGSFTGLRIGVSTIKGFCYATSKPCIGVDTLMALCYNFWACSDFLMPILDAKSQKVFTGIFRFEKGKLKTYHPTSILDIEEAKELAKNMILFCLVRVWIFMISLSLEYLPSFCSIKKHQMLEFWLSHLPRKARFVLILTLYQFTLKNRMQKGTMTHEKRPNKKDDKRGYRYGA